jgi:hypothetical protein
MCLLVMRPTMRCAIRTDQILMFSLCFSFLLFSAREAIRSYQAQEMDLVVEYLQQTQISTIV